jgi:cystathionine gamma-synthase
LKRHSQHPATLAVHAGDRKKPADGVPVTTPIVSASSFFYDCAEDLDAAFDERRPGQSYTRYGNPTSQALEEQVAALEGADFAVATSSGMSALHLSLSAALMDRRKSVVAANLLYGQTMSLLTAVLEPTGVETHFADPQDLAAWERAIEQARPSCVLLEPIANPLLRVPELDKAAAIARRHGATVVVDSTFATPLLLRPLELGCDIVVHSATKYLAGHGDVLAGVLAAKEEMRAAVRFLAKTTGPNLGPFEAYLTMRGVKTLPLRFERQCANARVVAEALGALDGVERVYFPGDPSHPDHATARRLFPEGMFGAMVAFDLAGGRAAAMKFLDALEMAVPATSLGDVHTMALYPAMASHRDLSPKHRERLGIGDGLIRLSVGIEAVDDIIGDLAQAVRTATRTATPVAAG